MAASELMPVPPLTSTVDFAPHDELQKTKIPAAVAAPDKSNAKSAADSLRTPVSAGYPSNVQSPLTSTISVLRRDEGPMKTPVTPPSAYLDFLRNVSPGLMSPLSTASSTTFSFGARPSSSTTSSKALTPTLRRDHAASAPPLSAHSILDQGESPSPELDNCSEREPKNIHHQSVARCVESAPPSASSSLPPDPHCSEGPTSHPVQFARSEPPRRPSLVIPPSPSIRTDDVMVNSSNSSATSFTPQSARSTGVVTPVTVRHIITRTVTYTRPCGATARATASDLAESRDLSRPLVGDAPKGKRRKIE